MLPNPSVPESTLAIKGYALKNVERELFNSLLGAVGLGRRLGLNLPEVDSGQIAGAESLVGAGGNVGCDVPDRF